MTLHAITYEIKRLVSELLKMKKQKMSYSARMNREEQIMIELKELVRERKKIETNKYSYHDIHRNPTQP